MNRLQNGIWYYVHVMLTMKPRGRLAIGNWVTSTERPKNVHINVHMT